jgi:hypothetical protein
MRQIAPGEMRYVYTNLVGKPKHRCYGNNKMDLKKQDVMWTGFTWPGLGSSGSLLLNW